MKHVFFVHSYITDLVARRVVEVEHLSPQDVVFLNARNFTSLNLPYRRADVSLLAKVKGSLPRRILVGWREVKARDRQLLRLTGGAAFHLYTPQTMERYIQVIRSHAGCAGFSYLEEGLNSYCTRAEIERTHPPTEPRFREKLGFRFRVRESRFFEDGYTRVYGVSSEVFPDLSNRVVLTDVFSKTRDEQFAEIENILALDALTVHRRIRLKSLLAAITRLAAFLHSERITTIHYKLHPAQDAGTEGVAIQAALREGGVRAVQLPDHVCLEELANARPGIRYFVNLSSVGLYAAIMGCRVFSYASWVAQAEPGFATYIELTPRVFKDKVEFLPV